MILDSRRLPGGAGFRRRSPQTITRCPVFSSIIRNIFHCGRTLVAAKRMKLQGNNIEENLLAYDFFL
jgi:hypothetical protein